MADLKGGPPMEVFVGYAGLHAAPAAYETLGVNHMNNKEEFYDLRACGLNKTVNGLRAMPWIAAQH